MTPVPSELEQHAREEFLPSPELLQARFRLERELDQVCNRIEGEINAHLHETGLIDAQELADRDFIRRFPAMGKEVKSQEVPEEMLV